MFKNIFQKIIGIIQWTKKWHFFHLILVPPFVISCLIDLYPILSFFNSTNEDWIYLPFWNYFVYVTLFCIMFSINLFIYAIVLIYIFIRKKTIYISNDFLLYNKFYNFVYILSLLQLFWNLFLFLFFYISYYL